MQKAPVVLLLLTTILAGCTGSQPSAPVPGDPTSLDEGKGAIAGLVIDDAFRPLSGAFVLLQETGQTTDSNANGEFFFLNVEPGTYILKVTIAGHEAAPIQTTVVAGQFAEAQITARREVNREGTIVTQEYGVFIPCAVSSPAVAGTLDCTGDLSGDSYRAGVAWDYRDVPNVTYVIVEALMQREGNYCLEVREDEASQSGLGESWGGSCTRGGQYARVILEYNVSRDGDRWTNELPSESVVFYMGDIEDPTDGDFGVGAEVGTRGTILQHVLIGEPAEDVDVEVYCVLCRS